jgi:NADH dehydrogenase
MNSENMKKKRILITGAAGFVGKEVCKYFSSLDYEVFGLIRKPLDKTNKIPGIRYILADIRDNQQLLTATKKMDYLIHLAGAKSDEKDSFDINVKGAMNIINTAAINNIQGIVYVSTLSTKIKNKGTYAQTKLAAEKIFKDSRIPAIIFRPSVIYGNKTQGVFGSIVQATKLPIIPVFGDGKTIFYPIYTKDFAACIEKVIRQGVTKTKIYDIGGRESITFNDLIKKIAYAQEKGVILVHIPAFIGLMVAKLLASLFYRPPISVSNILGSTQNVSVDIDKFYRDYNFEAISLNSGLSKIFGHKLRHEAQSIYAYITSQFSKQGSATDDFISHYITALNNNKLTLPLPSLLIENQFILGLADSASSLFYKQSLLQKKLFIASALFECSPESAKFLLPKQVPKIFLLINIFITSIQMASKLFLVLIFFPFIYSLILYDGKNI